MMVLGGLFHWKNQVTWPFLSHDVQNTVFQQNKFLFFIFLRRCARNSKKLHVTVKPRGLDDVGAV